MLNQIRKWCTKPLVMLPLVGMFTFVSCKKPVQVSSSTDPAKENNVANSVAAMRGGFTSIDYLKGIIFAKGPVADLIPELAELKLENYTTDPTIISYASIQQDQIINDLTAADPTFLDNFTTQMTSGDPVVIKAGINNAISVLKPILNRHYNYESEANQDRVDQAVAEIQASGTFDTSDPASIKAAIKDYLHNHTSNPVSGVCVVWALAVAVVVVAAVLIWVVVAGSDPTYFTSHSGLYQDNLINSISLNL